MTLPNLQVQTVPYPTLPGPFYSRSVDQQLRLRRFGTSIQDLEVNFSADRPNLLTDLLACCTLPQADRDLLWELPVGKRMECLLLLLSLEGIEQLDIDLKCSQCHLTFEANLTIEELLRSSQVADRNEVYVHGKETLQRFRRPTGRDQLSWLSQTYVDEAHCTATMMATLALDGAEVSAAELESALDEVDPLLRAPLKTACPECSYEEEHEADLTGIGLSRLQRSQDSLFLTIDLLASRYHWSESEILALPEWRRQRYEQLLRQETP